MKSAAPTSARPHRGQTLIFMLMMMVILTFVAFSVYDTQHVAVQRVRTQIASDSAALTGARWQLSCLNAIGELNLMKVTMEIVSTGLPPEIGMSQYDYPQYPTLFSTLDKLQAKIAITGPMMGVFYAEQAAKLNGMHAVPFIAETFQSFAQFIEDNAGNPNAFNDEPWLLPPVYDPTNPADMQERQQLLQDYATLMREIATQGMPVLPNFFPADLVNAMDWTQASTYAREYLPNPAFYAAIAGRDWCFLKQLLAVYSDWPFWGPVYLQNGISPFLVLSLQLQPRRDPYMGMRPDQLSAADIAALNAQSALIDNQLIGRGLTMNPNWPGRVNWPLYGDYGDGSTMTNAAQPMPRFDQPGVSLPGPYVTLNWAEYKNGWNTKWDAAAVGLYLNGGIKNEYNYAGQYADSVWYGFSAASITMAVPNYSQTSWTAPAQSDQLSQDLRNLWQRRTVTATAGESSGIQASAYAKAFGYIDSGTGAMPPPECPVVLPVFTDVRLIPSIVSSGSSTLDIAFAIHVMFHLPPYTQRGVYVGGCNYCDELRLWDNAAFRQIGKDWWAAQADNPNPCPVVGGGGGGGIVAH